MDGCVEGEQRKSKEKSREERRQKRRRVTSLKAEAGNTSEGARTRLFAPNIL